MYKLHQATGTELKKIFDVYDDAEITILLKIINAEAEANRPKG